MWTAQTFGRVCFSVAELLQGHRLRAHRCLDVRLDTERVHGAAWRSVARTSMVDRSWRRELSTADWISKRLRSTRSSNICVASIALSVGLGVSSSVDAAGARAA